MTTVSGTTATPYVAPTTTPTTTDTSSTAATDTTTPYDGSAAVAQAEALASQELSTGASGSSGNLLGLSPDILSLLQGTDGLASTLLGGSSGNAFYATQAQIALYGTAQKNLSAAQATDPISNLIDSNNSISNAASAAAVAAVTASDTSTDTSDGSTGATGTSA